MTYGDMISSALRQLPGRRGTLEEIYGVMETKFGAQLNTELEAGPRQVRGSGVGVRGTLRRAALLQRELRCAELLWRGDKVGGVLFGRGMGTRSCCGGGIR